MKKISYLEWSVPSPRYWALLGVLALVAGVGVLSAYFMEHDGHWITGMTNLVVWGTPHVFAVFLIVAASGALNVASIGTVFGRTPYKPLARLSSVLAVALLAGGLAVLVLDLGRPDRLIVAMTHYNFKSIFAWNIFLYTGFMAIVLAYLFTQMERKAGGYYKPAGFGAFVWRLILTTGTGSIFGFLVSRQAYDSALMAPWFILMSFAFGMAIFILVLLYTYKEDDRELGDVVLFRLKNVLGLFLAAVLFFTAIYHLTKLYGTKYHGVEDFILLSGGIYTLLFWLGHVLLGGLVPMGIVWHPVLGKNRAWIASAAGLVILGGLMTMYVVIIGAQAYPLQVFPGKTVLDLGYDIGNPGQIAPYVPSLPEFLLGLGGVAIALLITVAGVRMLKLLPESLADAVVDPHVAARSAGK